MMLGFREYLAEVFDNPYSYTKREAYTGPKGTVHRYGFEVPHRDGNIGFRVRILHSPKEPSVGDVDFDRTDSDDTYKKVTNPNRVFSTVRKIALDHAKKHPHLTHVSFVGLTDGLQKLYGHALRSKRIDHTSDDNIYRVRVR